MEIIYDVLEKILATVEELQASFTDLQTKVGAALSDLQAEVANLEASGNIPPAALDSLKSQIDTLAASVAGADPGAQTPPPPPPA